MNSFKESFKIAKILASLFTHSATQEEEKEYQKWIDEKPEHEEIANRVLNEESYKRNNLLINNFPPQKAWDKIYPLLGSEKPIHHLTWKNGLKYAALILMLIVPATYFAYHWNSSGQIKEIIPGTRGGEVTLSDGNTLNIAEGIVPEDAIKYFIIDSKGINYQTPANKPQIKEIKNTLRTLHGMECRVTLSDGTEVHLNAESKLTYPVCFSKKNRVVEIQGEAYFDVVPDKEHPFIVRTPHVSVQVTGTSFNVRAYADEPTESTTLISGGVKVISTKGEFELTPNQHFVYDKASTNGSVSNVNTELYTSWQSGSFIFMNVPLENVMAYLSKWYGFNYSFSDEVSKQVKIGAYLNRYENMNPILNMIRELNLVEIKQKDGILYISKKQ